MLFASLDFNTKSNIACFLDRSDIESFSQQNKDCAYSCAFIYCQVYAECITTDELIPVEVVSVLRKVVRYEETKEIASLIVEKIFQICGSSVLLLKKKLMSPLLLALMTWYHIDDLDEAIIKDACTEIPPQIIQHVMQCSIVNNFLYTKVNKHVTKESLVIAFIYENASRYCCMTSADTKYICHQHKFLLVLYDDIFTKPQLRHQIKSIFLNVIGDIEFVIDFGQHRSIPDNFNRNDFQGEVTIAKISIIGDSLISIGQYFLCQCSRYIMSVWIPKNVKTIGDCFLMGCNRLTSVRIPNTVDSIGDAFLRNCTSLTSIIIPDTVESIGHYFLYGCTSLTSIIIPNKVESIGNFSLYRCTSLTSVRIPDNLESISHSFLEGCTSLTSIIIPNNVKSVGDSFLDGCTSLTSIIIPNNVKSIGNYFLYGCSMITAITLPNSVQTIGNAFLQNCSSLNIVIIPSSVMHIGDNFANECSNLTTVVFSRSSQNRFESLIESLVGKNIYVEIVDDDESTDL